jgi:hypothetical protein
MTSLTGDRAELSRGFKQRTGRWPTDHELNAELPRTVRGALDRELAGRPADPVAYENAVRKVAGRLEKAARRAAGPAAPAAAPSAAECERLAATMTDQAAAAGFAALARRARDSAP